MKFTQTRSNAEGRLPQQGLIFTLISGCLPARAPCLSSGGKAHGQHVFGDWLSHIVGRRIRESDQAICASCQAQLQPGTWPHLRQLPTHRYHSVDGSHWNEAGNVMKWSGDKTLGSFSVYLEDDSRAAYYLHKRWKTLTAQEGARSIESAEGRAAKPLQNKQLAV